MHANVRRTRRSGQVGYGRAVAHGVNTMTGSAKPRRPDGASWLAGAGSRCLWVVLAGRRVWGGGGGMGVGGGPTRKGGLAGAWICEEAQRDRDWPSG